MTDNEVGDLGPVYGFQWRHFGADYKTMHTDYTGQGVDQLSNVIQRIKTNPCCRRIIMSAWNPVGKKEIVHVVLQSCHESPECNGFEKLLGYRLGVAHLTSNSGQY